MLQKKKARRSGFLANVATVLGGQAASVALAFLTEVAFTRLLGPEPRGQISLCMMAIALGTLIGGLGADVPIVIWVADQKKKLSEWLSTISLWGFVGVSLACGVWWLVYWRGQSAALRGVTPELAKVVLVTIPLAILFGHLMAFLTGAERFRERAAVGLAEACGGLGGFLVLSFVVGKNAEAAMWGNAVGMLLGIVAGAALLRNLFAGSWAAPAMTKEVRSGMVTGLRGQIGNVAAFFNYRLDIFIVNYFLDPAQVGLYTVGVVVSEGLWQIPQAVATALFPRTARTVKEGAAEFTCLIVRHVFLISVVSGIALALLCPVLIPVLFGVRFTPSVAVIWWILPGTVALAVAKVAASDLAGRYKTGYNSAFGIIAFSVTVILDFVLIPRMGIRGAALASSTAYLLNSGLVLAALKYEFKVRWRSLLLPSRVELGQYRRAWFSFVAWSRLRNAPTQ